MAGRTQARPTGFRGRRLRGVRRFKGRPFRLRSVSQTKPAAERKATTTYHTNRYRILKGKDRRGRRIFRLYVGARRSTRKGCVVRR